MKTKIKWKCKCGMLQLPKKKVKPLHVCPFCATEPKPPIFRLKYKQ